MALLTTTVILLIISIVILFVIYKFAKKAFKIVIIVYVIFFLASSIFGINLLQQAKEFNTKFPTSEKLFLLKQDGTITAAFSGKLTKLDEQPTFISAEQVADFNDLFAEEDLEGIKGNTYLLFIVDEASFDDIDQTTIAGDEYTKDIVLAAISSSSPDDILVESILEKENLPDTPETRNFVRKEIIKQLGADDDTQLRGVLFAGLLAGAMEQGGVLFIVTEFQDDNIIIYPENLVFKVMRFLPAKFIGSLINDGNT